MSVRVVCDDTDVFVLLVHFYNSKCKNSNVMIMSSSLKEWDMGATAEAHSDIANDMLAIHGLSGADIVATLHGIGKATVIKVSKTGLFHSLNLVLIRPTWNLLKLVQRTSYVPHTATKSYTSMTECRVDLKGSTQKQEEWCIIIKTLLTSTNQWCIQQKCTQRINASCGMEVSNSRVTAKYGPSKVLWLGAWPWAYSTATNSVIC